MGDDAHVTEEARDRWQLRGAAELLLGAWREDGRFRLSPSCAIYPCHTINAVRVLSLLGHASDDRVRRSFQHVLGTLHDDGGATASAWT